MDVLGVEVVAHLHAHDVVDEAGEDVLVEHLARELVAEVLVRSLDSVADGIVRLPDMSAGATGPNPAEPWAAVTVAT